MAVSIAAKNFPRTDKMQNGLGCRQWKETR
jgi:hypothetical protein